MTPLYKESPNTHSPALTGYTFPSSPYTNQDRIKACTVYLVSGTLKGTSKACGIPITTLYDWKKTDWWQQLSESVRIEKEDEFRAGFTRIIDAAIGRTEEALVKGEAKLVKTKDGYEERRVPVGAKDATMIAAISYDKLRLSMNLPTSISQSSGNSGIQAKLEELSRKLEQREVSVISEQYRLTETQRAENAKLVGEPDKGDSDD